MELSEDEIILTYAKHCAHCNGNTLLPYEYEWTCVSCGYNVIQSKHEFIKIQKKINFINRLKYAGQKIFCICVDVDKICEGNDYDKFFEALSTLKTLKLKINNALIEKHKDLLENPDFEQDYWSRTAIGVYKIGHDSNRIMKWLAS